MALILKYFFRGLYNLTNSEIDPHMEQYLWVRSPWPLIITTLSYMLFVHKVGPALMANRSPMQLKKIILGYNVLQMLVNAYIFVRGIQYVSYMPPNTFFCMQPLADDHHFRSIELNMCYLYYLVKVFDYLDTVFFVLRKSFKQVTYLHIYHHVLMSVCGYLYLRFIGPGGHQTFVGIINSLIHVLMYGYYYASAVNPKFKESKWKKTMTLLQLTQFVLIICHQTYPFIFMSNCRLNVVCTMFAIAQAAYMIAMFGEFYIKAYGRRGKVGKVGKPNSMAQKAS